MFAALSSPWIPSLILIGLALAARQVRGNWLSPAAFIALVWTVYVFACLLLTDYVVHASGIWVIVLFVFSLQFGTVLAEGLAGASYSKGVIIEPEMLGVWEKRSLKFATIFAIVGLVGCAYLVFFSLEKFSLDFSGWDLLSLGHLWSTARYEQGELEPWSVRLMIMWVYPAVLLAGIGFALSRTRRQKWLTALPLVPAALIGTVFAARAGLLISLICWAAGFFAARYRQTCGRYKLFQRKLVLALGSLAISGFLFFVIIDAVRVYQGDSFEVGVDVPRLSKYFLGSVPAFCNWVHDPGDQEPTFGAYTFAGVFDLLGLKHREIGVYEEMQTLQGGEDTNIYTVFRGLIQDFTLAGASIFGVLIGIVAGAAAQSPSKKHLRSLLILAGYYAFALYSPVISLFVYNGLILAWLVAALVLGLRSRQSATESSMLPSPV
jgi:oligosaccharide repeat unit polymerase